MRRFLITISLICGLAPSLATARNPYLPEKETPERCESLIRHGAMAQVLEKACRLPNSHSQYAAVFFSAGNCQLVLEQSRAQGIYQDEVGRLERIYGPLDKEGTFSQQTCNVLHDFYRHKFLRWQTSQPVAEPTP